MMNKELLSTALWNEWFIALYSYAISPWNEAAVVVVDTFTSDIAESLKKVCTKSQQIIILTRNDLEYGDDVYSVPLLHMQIRGVCEWGEDLFGSISITGKELRPHLEWMMRHVLIDLREAMTRKSPSEEVKKWMSAQYDRILCGCATYLWMKEWYVREDMEEMIAENWSIECAKLWAILDEKKSESWWMMDAHTLLLELVDTVDWL